MPAFVALAGEAAFAAETAAATAAVAEVGAGAVVAGEVAAESTSLLASGFTAFGTKFTVGGILASTAFSLGTSYLLSAMSKPPANKDSLPTAAGNRMSNVRQAITYRTTVYGQVRVGGAITFLTQGTPTASTGSLGGMTDTSGAYIHLVLTLAGHEVEDVGSVYFNDVLVRLDGNGWALAPDISTVQSWAGKARVLKACGSPATDKAFNAALSANAPDKWTAAHTQTGHAKLYVMFVWDATVFSGGLPTVTAVVKGAKIYDPRTAVTAWSANPALCLRDYLTSVRYGVGVPESWINDVPVCNSAANNCDEDVTLSTSYPFTANIGPGTLTLGASAQVSWSSGTTVYLSSTGALPAPLVSGTDYYVVNPNLNGVGATGTLRLTETLADSVVGTGNPIGLTTVGSGTHTVFQAHRVVGMAGSSSTFTADPATGRIRISGSPAYQTGTLVLLRTSGALPSPFSAATPYFLVNPNASGLGDSSTYGLASTKDLAFAGTTLSANSVGSGAHTLYFPGYVYAENVNVSTSNGLVPALGAAITMQTGDALVVKAVENLDIYWAAYSTSTTVDYTGSGVNPDYTSSSATTTTNFPQAAIPYSASNPPEPGCYTTAGGLYVFTPPVNGATRVVIGNGTPQDVPTDLRDTALPNPLTSGTTYYWILVDSHTGMLAPSRADALAGLPVGLTSGGTALLVKTSEQRYLANGTFTSDRNPEDVLHDLLTSCAGKVAFTGGAWNILAGVWHDPAVDSAGNEASIGMDDMLGPISLTAGISRRDLPNGVRGTFCDTATAWQPTEGPLTTAAQYVAADGGAAAWQDVQLPFTTSSSTFQRICQIVLKSARRQITWTVPCKLTVMRVPVGGTVKATHTGFGFSDKTFFVEDWTLSPKTVNGAPYLGVDLFLKEDDAEVYAWDPNLEVSQPSALAPRTANPFSVEAPGNIVITETLYTIGAGAQFHSYLNVSWTNNDPYAASFGVDYRTHGSSELSGSAWTAAGGSLYPSTSAVLSGFSPGSYDVRVKCLNTLGASSGYATSAVTVQGPAMLPDLTAAGILGIDETLVAVNSGQGVNSLATISVSAVLLPSWSNLGVNIASYEVQRAAAGTSIWTTVATGPSSPLQVLNSTGSFDWRARAATSVGALTPWSTTFTKDLAGLVAAPADPTGFTIVPSGNQLLASWDAAVDLDVKIGGYFLIRYSSEVSGVTWRNAAHQATQHVSGASTSTSFASCGNGTYVLRAFDSSGTASTGVVTHVLEDAPDISPRYYTWNSVTEGPAFLGTKTHLVATDALKLDLAVSTFMDDITDLVDDWSYIDYLNIGSSVDTSSVMYTSGTYYFQDILDLAGVYTVRLETAMVSNVLLLAPPIDAISTDIDSWAAFDGGDANADTSISLYLQTSQVAAGDHWSSWRAFATGDFTARQFQFKLEFRSSAPQDAPEVSALTIAVKLPYYAIQIAQGAVVPDTGASYTYLRPFHSSTTPSIAVSSYDMGTGDYYQISESTHTGFTIKFFNSSNSGKAVTADITALGYGQLFG